MGSNTSKETNNKKALQNPKTPQKETENKLSVVLEPKTPAPSKCNIIELKSPCIHQTPLTQIIANHLNGLSAHDGLQHTTIQTPSYLLRKKILHDLGYAYSINDTMSTDPRSPSQLIPRTPINLALGANDTNQSMTSVGSFQYSGLVEENSCRKFNEKLANITLDDCDGEQCGNQSKNETDNSEMESFENGNSVAKHLYNEKTPDFMLSPESTTSDEENKVENRKELKIDDEQAMGTTLRAKLNVPMQKYTLTKGFATPLSAPKTPNDRVRIRNIYVTPINKFGLKTNRSTTDNKRTPLSLLNRRAISSERTPIQSKQFSSDENQSSQRSKSASKIPIPLRK